VSLLSFFYPIIRYFLLFGVFLFRYLGFNLAPCINNNIKSKNIFTTIVGKNGTGKSRLLESIINEFIIDSELTHLSIKYSPTNIIAVSISPFDKFPFSLRREEENEYYSYLGLKGLYSQDFSRSYMSKIVYSLIESILNDSNRIHELINVLNYLGYSEIFDLTFEIEPEWRTLIRKYNESLANDTHQDIKELFVTLLNNQPKRRFYRFFFENDKDSLTNNNIDHALDILFKMQDLQPRPLREFNLQLTKEGLVWSHELIQIKDNLLFMLDSGILKLKKVVLQKKDRDEPQLISEASSGEQSVIMSILGIASKIQNGSLICIDEPEICLHPSWQEKYIELITHTFKDYKGCHFLIATHSPQIISKLENQNCYVMTMNNGNLIEASSLNNKSIDFQLAHVFKSPGYKNEYLTRELISLITLIAEGKGQEELASPKIEEILALKDVIDDEDPVKELIRMVESVKKELK